VTNAIYTIGHSTHPIVVDVRTIAKSRYVPQFNEEELNKSLSKFKIEYQRLEILGGLRHTTKDSINKAWKNTSFRGYADYMQTPQFATGVKQLIEIAKTKQTVIMCAEAVPWRCHRSLIGDALLVSKINVEDIMSEKLSKPHAMTAFAKVVGSSITYPAGLE
jgi:uncharacterized protein (DUF488 family)